MIELREGDFGNFLIVDLETGRNMLIQIDWDYPWLASTFGWAPCHQTTDGTVDCPECGRTIHDLIGEAYDYLLAHLGDKVEDPGYFD